MDKFFDEDGQETIDPDHYFYQDEDGDACMTSTLLNYLLSIEHSVVMRAIMRVREAGTTNYYRPISLSVGESKEGETLRRHEAYLIKPTGFVLMAPYLGLNEQAFKFAQELAGKFINADKHLKEGL